MMGLRVSSSEEWHNDSYLGSTADFDGFVDVVL